MGNKNRRKRRDLLEEVKVERKSGMEGEGGGEGGGEGEGGEGDEKEFHKDLWIYSMSKASQPLPAINQRARFNQGSAKNKSLGVVGKE